MLRLFADTDCDITPEIAKEYGYHLISMPYSMDDKTIYPYEDYDKFDCHGFYETLRTGDIPTTSAISEEKYKSYFEEYFAAGDDILYVHFSAAMSATFTPMRNAVKELSEKYPDARFYEIDTRGISILGLNILCEIGDMVKQGATIDEIMKWAETEIDHFAVYFFADDLRFFKKSGRVSGLAGTMGTLLGIRPIIYVGEDGKMVSIGKEKGRQKAIERLGDYVEELGDNIKEHRVLVANADCDDIVEMMCEMLKRRFGDDLEIQVVEVNPTIGCHCGPNASGISFHSKHR